VERLGHKLYMDNYFSSPALFDDMFGRKINCCGTVCSDGQGMPKDISSQAIKAKKGDIITRVRGNQSIVHWKDKRGLCSHRYAYSSSGRQFLRRIWPWSQTSCNRGL